MKIALLDGKVFYNIYGKKQKINLDKNYEPNKLYKLCNKKGKPVLKNLLMLNTSIEKLENYYCASYCQEKGLKFNFDNLNSSYEKMWIDFFTNYQNALAKEIEQVQNIMENLRDDSNKKSIAEKYEQYNLYLCGLIACYELKIDDIKQMAFEKFHEENDEWVKQLISILNLYRHVKEYERVQNSYRFVDLSNGIDKNKQSVKEIIAEIENLKFDSSPELLKIKQIFDAFNNGETSFKLVNKSKTKTIDIKTLVDSLDSEYLFKLNAAKSIVQYYISLSRSIYKKESASLNVEDFTKFAKSKFPYLNETYTKLCTMNYEYFRALTDFKKEYDILSNGTIEMIKDYNERQELSTDKIIGMCQNEMNFNITELRLAVANKRPFQEYSDPLVYTIDDFYLNTPSIVEGKTVEDNNTKEIRKENAFKNEFVEETNKPSNNSFEEKFKASNRKKKPISQQIDEHFEGLIGLNDVKETLIEIVSKKILQGKNYKQGQMHMAFLGNPGTGKTTVARIVGNILYENGLINSNKVVEVKFNDLYQNYVGFSAKATANAIKEAEGGVLFIDEAHQFCTNDSSKDFRKEIINTLVPELENNKNLLVIFAGYSKELLQMLQGSDKGLFSRVNHRVDFRDFTKQELMELFKLEISKRKNRNDENFELEEDCYKMVDEYIELLIKSRKDNFANGREIRITVEKILNKFGVLALDRTNIKTIDANTMAQILQSQTFKSEILSSNENDSKLNKDWEQFVFKLNNWKTKLNKQNHIQESKNQGESKNQKEDFEFTSSFDEDLYNMFNNDLFN